MFELIIGVGAGIWTLVFFVSLLSRNAKPVEFWTVSLFAFFTVVFVVGVPLAGIAYLVAGKEAGQFVGEFAMAGAMVYAIYKGVAA
jgi:hypothetical protein